MPLFLSLSFSGWIVSLAALKTKVGVGVIMMINAIFFTAQAAMGVIMLKKVNKFLFIYGDTDCFSSVFYSTSVVSNL